MTSTHDYEKLPVPRSRIFVLNDGTFVVQWEENRVQDLITGRYKPYSADDFGNAITNYELNQLCNTGIVDTYDNDLVYLSPSLAAHAPKRSFYLNTTLAKSELSLVEASIEAAGVADRFSVRSQEIFVILRDVGGKPYPSFEDAEKARELLVQKLPDLLGRTAVAFVEINTLI